jgi:branched-chain amino acid transport system ATP-binding protein
MTEMTPIVAAEGLHAYYGTSHILRGIDLSVRRGEVVGLVGRNGMGKTTTLRALIGLMPVQRGELRIHGRVMTGSAAHRIVREGIAMVPEGRGIFPNLTVLENLLMAARAGRDGGVTWSIERVFEVFPRVAERARQMGHQLSGGEQQMLAIGRALVTNPDLLILDEATEGLAPLLRREIWGVIRRIKAADVAALIVDRDVEALAGAADRCLVIAKGQIVHSGQPGELAADRATLIRHLGV